MTSVVLQLRGDDPVCLGEVVAPEILGQVDPQEAVVFRVDPLERRNSFHDNALKIRAWIEQPEGTARRPEHVEVVSCVGLPGSR